jgi:hypothetical protein
VRSWTRWFLIALTIGCLVASVPAFLQQQNPTFIVAFLAYTAVGIVVTGRRPDSSLGWVFLGVAVLGSLLAVSNEIAHRAFVEYAPPRPGHAAFVEVSTWAWLGAWLNGSLYFAFLDLATVWTFLLFPSGLRSRSWRAVFWVNAVALFVATLYMMVRPYVFLGSDEDLHRLCDKIVEPCFVAAPNLLTLPFMSGILDPEHSELFDRFDTVFVVTGLLSVIAVFIRFVHSRGVERLQMLWFAFAAGLVVLAFVIQAVFPHLPSTIGNALFSLVIAFVPISCGIAILRYRLYDIDRIISRTAAYLIVTGALLAVYAVIVTSVTRLVGSTSSLAVAAATIAAAALFRPLLVRVQRVVDRRFNREKVDAQAAIDEFGALLSDEVDDEHAEDELVAVARKVLQPGSVALWVHASQVTLTDREGES